MNTQEMADWIRKYRFCKGQDEQWDKIGTFLHNLPRIPYGFAWDGTIRIACDNEWALDWQTGHAFIMDGTRSPSEYPILTSLRPKFRTGEIVWLCTNNSCFVVTTYYALDDLRGCRAYPSIPLEARVATDKELACDLSYPMNAAATREMYYKKYT